MSSIKLKFKYILSNFNKFEKLENDENRQFNFLIDNEKRKDFIKPLYQKECLTKKEYDNIKPTGSRSKIFHDRAKVHKPIIDNCPSFRPILSAANKPTYNLAKFLVHILSPLTVNEFTAHNIFSSAEEVDTFNANCIMVSLDVERLFINIPLDETIENCIKDPFQIMIQFTILSKEISKNFSNLLHMSCFLHLITNIIVNQMVLPWNPHYNLIYPMYFIVIFKKSYFLIVRKLFALTFKGGV